MSSIQKLSFSGFRSYSPDEEIIIKFFKPLTLIVGKNGVGKTTIIECLKLAISGAFPPNALTGKAFISEPKLLEKSQVKAKVQVLFTSVNERKMLGSRAFKLTDRASKSEFRRELHVLKTKTSDGEIISVDYKSEELDKSMAELLGISQAILENVIFCHQEESLWPFGNPATIKSIFDELFDTMHYTSALDNLKKVLKAHQKKAKELSNAYQVEKTKFEELLGAQNNLLGETDEIKKLQKNIIESKEKIQNLEEARKPVENKNNTVRDLNVTNYRISIIEQEIKTLKTHFERNNLEIFKGSLEDLQNYKKTFAEKVGAQHEELEEAKQNLEKSKKNKDALQENIIQMESEERSQSEAEIKLKDYRDKILKLIEVDIMGSESDVELNKKILNEARTQREKIANEVNNELRTLREEERKVDIALSTVKSNLVFKETSLRNFSKEMNDIEETVKKLRNEVNRPSEMLLEDEGALEKEIEELDIMIENSKDDLGEKNRDLDEKTNKLIQLLAEMEKNTKKRNIMLKLQEYNRNLKEFNDFVQQERDIKKQKGNLKIYW